MPRGTLWRQPSKLRIWKKVKNDKRTDKTATAAPPCGTAVRFKNKWAPHNRCFYLTLLLARASPPSHVPQKFKVGCFLFLYYFIIFQLLLPQSFSGRGCGERKERERERKKMNALGRQAQRSGASTMHQRQYSENFIDASSNGRWLQSAGLQHLQSSNASVPSLQVLIFLCFFPFTSCLVAKKEYRKEKEIFFFWLT